MGTGSNDVEAKDLQTPTLKGEHYTTGRGGTQHSHFAPTKALRDPQINIEVLTKSNQARETSCPTIAPQMRAWRKT